MTLSTNLRLSYVRVCFTLRLGPYYVSHHKEGQFLQSKYSRPDIPASSKRLFRPKLQRQNAIINKTMRDLSQKGFLHP